MNIGFISKMGGIALEKSIKVKGKIETDNTNRIYINDESLGRIINDEDFLEREVEITITCKDM